MLNLGLYGYQEFSLSCFSSSNQTSQLLDIFSCFINSAQTVATTWLHNKAEGPSGNQLDLGQAMERFEYEPFGDGGRESLQVDWSRVVGDTQPSNGSPREGEHYFRQALHVHGHKTAAQRYNATRIQAGFCSEK